MLGGPSLPSSIWASCPCAECPIDRCSRAAGELRENLTVYDAAYVALAELLEVVLLTADARLARAPGLRCQVDLVGA